MLLLERSMPGIECKKMECMGVWPSGTTYIEFDSVRVPKCNIIGVENQGFKQVRPCIHTQATTCGTTTQKASTMLSCFRCIFFCLMPVPLSAVF